MKINKADGCMIAGFVSRDPEEKAVGSDTVVKFSVRYDSEAPAPGEKYGKGIFVDVDAWGDLGHEAKLLKKGDFVIVVGKAQTREFNGKTYATIRADGISPDVLYYARQIERLYKMMPAEQMPAAIAKAVQDDYALINDDSEDLPW